jgi:hypothetical protein
MIMRENLAMGGRDFSWLHRTFETHLPVAELCTILIPTIMFGMFTMGLNPEDSVLRMWYYLVITAVMPVSMLAGYLLALIPARKLLLVLFDVATSVVAFLSYLWFQARISVVQADVTSTFPGWHWQSHYQQNVLIAFVVIMSCRCGMSFPRRGGRPSSTRDSSVVSAAAFSLLLVASTYIVSWLLGTWWLLHLQLACLALAGASVQLLLPDHSATSEGRSMAAETKRKAWKPVLFGISIPLLMLGQGFTIGLSFVANSWSAGWLGNIGTSLIVAGLVTCAVLAIEHSIKKVMGAAWFLLGAAGSLATFIALLMSRVFLPVELGWAVANGVAAGLVAIALARLATNDRKPFRATIHLLMVVFCTIIGIGGGIAYYLYAPWGDDIIIWIVLGAIAFAAAVVGHVPIVSLILLALNHKVNDAIRRRGY